MNDTAQERLKSAHAQKPQYTAALEKTKVALQTHEDEIRERLAAVVRGSGPYPEPARARDRERKAALTADLEDRQAELAAHAEHVKTLAREALHERCSQLEAQVQEAKGGIDGAFRELEPVWTRFAELVRAVEMAMDTVQQAAETRQKIGRTLGLPDWGPGADGWRYDHSAFQTALAGAFLLDNRRFKLNVRIEDHAPNGKEN